MRPTPPGVPPRLLVALAALAACTPRPPAWEVANPVRPLPAPPLGSPVDLARLPIEVSPEKVRLGRWLFYDARLSDDGAISCGTRHQPRFGFSEPEPVSTGVRGQKGHRRAPPILNAAYTVYPVYFWDGRASTLIAQARGPMENPVEMGMTHDRIALTVRGIASYRHYFREVFGDDRIDIDRVAEAIAAYEATRLSGNSPFDRFDAGDERALDTAERAGRDLFFGKAACNQCHLGPNFTDTRFHNLGVGWRDPPTGADPRTGFADAGRYAVTREEKDRGAFKTPTLREVARRPPYMHDGSVPTLREVVRLYDRGGIANPWLSPEVKPLHLSPSEIDALVAFMEALSGEGFQDAPPSDFPM